MELSQVFRDQKQELSESFEKKKIINREAMAFFGNAAGSKLIKVVTGVRRCGKSVFSHEMLAGKSFAYANFDDDRILGITGNQVLSSFYELYSNGFENVFLDEVQNLQNWELFVNRLHRLGLNVFITGSNSKLLSKELATSLTGRHMRIELFPFSFREYLQAIGFSQDAQTTRGQSMLKTELKNYLHQGGFPDVVVEKENPSTFLRELYRNIIERDVVSRYKITFAKTFKEIAMTLISNQGRAVSFNKLRNHFNLGSEHTVKNYVSYLEEAYLIFLVNRFSHKPVEVEKSEKKVYAIDTGMANALSTRPSEEHGRAFENVVAIELLRRKSFNPAADFYYWKSPLQEEVDFVVKEGSRVRQLIQVCYDPNSLETNEREIKSLTKASKELKCNNLLVITNDYDSKEKTTQRGKEFQIQYAPLHKWLLEKPTS